MSDNKLDNEVIIDLKRRAIRIRKKILDMCLRSGGHIVSSFSCVDILVALYYGDVLKVDSKNPEWEDRDRFILSKGHGETALYAVLSDKGFFPAEWTETSYRQNDCCLGGHPDIKTPGIEVTTGALGHGLGLAAGISLAARMDGKSHLQFVLMGDAECTEGSVWEAALFASKHKLNNLIVIIDRNRIGSIDFIENYTSLEPFSDKWRAFGWAVTTCNGHDFGELLQALHNARKQADTRPHVILAETVKGKGISFMENDPCWHARALTKEDEIQLAKEELRRCADEII
jgi:transketolase